MSKYRIYFHPRFDFKDGRVFKSPDMDKEEALVHFRVLSEMSAEQAFLVELFEVDTSRIVETSWIRPRTI